MAVLSMKIEGLDKAIGNIKGKYGNVKQDVQDELNNWAEETALDAKSLAPKDEGHLAGSIRAEYGNMEAAVTVAVDYAAYVEFGTRKFSAAYVSSLPPDWQSFANKFKGSAGGNFKEFILRIMRWCKAHGIEEKAAYPIVLKILRDGVKAQPYLYPAVIKNNKKLTDRIKNIFK